MSTIIEAKSKAVLLVAFFLCVCMGAAAQGGIPISGTVFDPTGETIIGASVTLKGHPGVGTVTDIDGNFKLSVPSASSIIVVSYVGMKPQEIKVGAKRVFKVTLADSQQALNEVVVVGYGQQKKASIVGSIVQTDAKTLERTGGVSSLGQALTGNLPGVITTSSTGMPGDEDPQIYIRGVSSWNSSSPLILVDGIERPMAGLDISTVQSISVLKDASATAVYGVKGANGVILITTKRGAEGPAHIEVGMNMVAKVASKLPKKMDSYEALYTRNQAIENELGLSPDSWSSILPMDIIRKYRYPATLEESERYPNVDWEDEIFRNTAFSYEPHVNISGGTKRVKYFTSVDFLHEGDLFRDWSNNRGYKPGFGYNRINVRSNLDFQVTHTTLLKANIFGSSGQKKGPYGVASNSWAETQYWQAAYSAAPDAFLPRYSDGSWGYYPQDEIGAPNSILNLALGGIEKTTTTRIQTDFTVEQKLDFILPGLKATGIISWDNTFIERNRGINDQGHSAQEKWINPDTGMVTYKQANDGNTNFDFQEGIKWNTASGDVDNGATVRNLYYQAQLYWEQKFDLHDVTAMGLFSRQENAVGSEFTHYREDWAFRATYNYAGKYFFEYNGAYNGSEKFSKDNRFAFFNSGAIGWMVSEEKFWNPIRKWFDMLKLRASYGEVGDDNVGSRWLYATQWAYGGSSYEGLLETNSPYTYYRVTQIGNNDVHWEKAVKRNFGVDFSVLGGLFTGTIDIFDEDRKDILIASTSRAVPSYYGMTAPTANLGKVRSHGYELDLKLNKVFHNKMRLWGDFNMTHAENEVKAYDEAEFLPDYQKQVGHAIGQTYTYLSNGYANTWDQVYAMTAHNTNNNQKLPGQYQIIDYNADGVIDTKDNAPYGYPQSNPQNTYNATLGLDWKGFSVMCQFYGVTNVSRTVIFTSFSGKMDNVYDQGSFWSATNTNADVPMPRWNSTPNGDYFRGTSMVYDGSYIRLKNVEISYTWDRGWIQSIGLNTLKLYLSGNNLWSWSRMPDDRESNFAGTGNASQGAYPTVKRFNVGIKFTL